MTHPVPFIRWSRSASLMHRMLDRLGISLIAACMADAPIAKLARTCGKCRNTDRCQDWLDSHGAAEERYAFCPNAKTMDKLPRRG
jgi:hypothetical protein